MTTTPELHELAKTPQAFDTVLAALHGTREARARAIATLTTELHDLAGDRKSYRNTRVPVWGMSDLEVTKDAQRKAAHGDVHAITVLAERAGVRAILDAIDFEIGNMGAVYMRQGNRWTRFFPSVTKSQPHIHRSLDCHTLHATTVMTWAPQLSGRTDAEAVDELDEALCSVCFPGAPVALHNYVSRRSQAEQGIRAAVKAGRDLANAAKRLAPSEVFRTTGKYGERVETVAKLKEMVRKAIELEVEAEFWATHSPAGWDIENLARRRRNIADSLVEARADAAKAREILMAREAAHEGWGADADTIAKMETTKRKSATREWAKI